MTQYEMIREYMGKGETLSPYEAFQYLHITKLATRISEMKRMGYEFDQWMETKNNFVGVPVRFMRYSLKKIPKRTPEAE